MFELNIELFNIAYNELKNNMDLLLDYRSLFKDLKSNIPDCIKNKQDEISEIISDYFSCEKNDLEIAKQMLTIKHHLEEASYQEQANSKKKDDGGFFNSAFNAIKDTCAVWGNGVSGVFRGEGFGGVGNAMAQTGATIYVASNSLVSGVAKVGETLGDGVAWVGGMSASGWVSLFNKDASNNIKNSTMNYIRRDLVGEDNQKFFENEAIGKWINSKSNLKYDSSAASGFQTGAEFASKIALATAATVFTGGAAAPVVIGAAYGIGNEEEKYAQSVNIELGEAYDYKKVFGRAVIGGVGGAAEFYGYGQLGSGIVNGIKGLKSGASSLSAETGVGNITTSFRKNFAKNFFVTDTLLDTGAVITKHGIGYAIGDESREQLFKEGGLELAFSLGLAAIGSGLGAYSDTKSARKALQEQSLKNMNNVAKAFENDMEIAEYFGDSNLYLWGNMKKQLKQGNWDLSTYDFLELKSNLYSNEDSAIQFAKKFLDSDQQIVYNKLLTNSSNSIQQKWIDSLTDWEKIKLRKYAQLFGSVEDEAGNIATLPELMRKGLSSGDNYIDSAIEKFGKLDRELITYRNVGIDALTSQFGEIDDLGSLVGKVYTDKAYMSSALSELGASSYVSDFDNVLLKIKVPTDANYGAYIESLSDLNYGNMEFLIKKNSKSLIENAFIDSDGNAVLEMTLFNK